MQFHRVYQTLNIENLSLHSNSNSLLLIMFWKVNCNDGDLIMVPCHPTYLSMIPFHLLDFSFKILPKTAKLTNWMVWILASRSIHLHCINRKRKREKVCDTSVWWFFSSESCFAYYRFFSPNVYALSTWNFYLFIIRYVYLSLMAKKDDGKMV